MQTIYIVPQEFVHQAWEKFGHFIEKAAEFSTGDFTADQLKVLLNLGHHNLILFLDKEDVIGALVFHFSSCPSDRIFFIDAVGGKTTKEHFEMMYNYAKSQGATVVRGCARESVARLCLIKHGFKQLHITVEKKL